MSRRVSPQPAAQDVGRRQLGRLGLADRGTGGWPDVAAVISVAGLARRIAVLEERQAGPLSRTELAELRRLEAQYDAEFPGCMHEWPTEKIYDYIMSHSVSARGGWMERLDILRERNDTPEQRAADRHRTCRILGLTEKELEE